jgi:hypothetical protein
VGSGVEAGLALARLIPDQLGDREQQGQASRRQATHREHQAEPATVRMGPLAADSSEGELREHGGDCTGEEDAEAGGKELAGIWTHKGSEVAAVARRRGCG